MRKLVEGLLTLARTDSNQMELSRRPMRLDAALRHAVELMEQLAVCKNLQVIAEIEDALDCVADEERLHQLFLIVLDNAIKYTPEHGRISVTCKKLAGSAQIAIADTGIGIPEQDLPYVFERFYRSDKTRSREQGGIGLGLAIAKWITERHGGQIRIESRSGSGTTVLIELPLGGKIPI